MSAFEHPRYSYVAPDDLLRGRGHVPVAIVGAGPIGLCAAIDLTLRGVRVVVLDDDDTVSIGSRAICWAKRTLEILDRLGVAERMIAKGVTWETGKVFLDDTELYRFDLADEGRQKHPAFINLQQYYAEAYLVERARELGIDLRWKNRVVGVTPAADTVTLEVDTPDGRYMLDADYVIAADGARSFVRDALGLDFEGKVFEDHFLIADVKMNAGFPPQRWFWFDPPFNRDQSALLHMQADDIWRIDLQIGWDTDAEEERKPEKVIPRIKRMLGEDTAFELVWTSVYTFQCRRLARFRHGRVFFAGDSAHQVSPFGARGANSGIQDVDNLAWKLALVLNGAAPDRLLDSYDDERGAAADENILNSTRSTDFITPKSAASRAFRDGALRLARDWPFARALVNSGRLSRPTTYAASPLNGPGGDLVGAPCPNAPGTFVAGAAETSGWLLDRLGQGFVGLYFADAGHLPDGLAELAEETVPVHCLIVSPTPPVGDFIGIRDADGHIASLFGAQTGEFVLIRPDQHVAARWPRFDAGAARAAVRDARAARESEPAGSP